MLLLLLPMYCFLFLAAGAVVFVLCAGVPWMRRFALSAALWCAVWGPCTIAWMLFTAMVGIAAEYGLNHAGRVDLHVDDWVRGFGLGMFWLAVASTAAVATVVAWLHQVLVKRMTLVLFRLYATLVAAGIGSVWGWAAGFAMVAYEVPYRPAVWIVTMVGLVAVFGWGAYRGARVLRGEAPERFTWITREEFEGTA
jgi:hypothetical protein